jgi:hypothetical protein
MKLYSDFSAQRARQIVADLISLALIGFWIWVGVTLYALVMNLAVLGAQLEQAGAGFRKTMSDVGNNLGGVPLIGAGIRVPFDGASDAGKALQIAGQSQQDAVHSLALFAGIGVAALPVLAILIIWLVPRIRFARRATSAKAQLESGASLELLALRALGTQKLSVLLSIDPNPVAAWRREDITVMRRLAAAQLRSSGVRLGV